MKAYLFILFLCFFTFHSNTQISASTSKKISKLIGDKFILLPNQNNYPYCFYSNELNIDMSTSLENDTVGVSFQNEHLLWHDLISFSNQKESLKLISDSPVTVQEYLEFQNYVRDSIARDKIYLEAYPFTSCWNQNDWTEDESKEWINYKDLYWDNNIKEYLEFDPSERELNKSLFSLNWDKKLNYNEFKVIPVLADMYLPFSDRIYNLKEYDQRKFFYKYSNTIRERYNCGINSILLKFPFTKVQNIEKYIKNEEFLIPEQTTTLIDNYSWAKRSKNERDEFSVLAHTYPKLFLTAPIIGINNAQAKAFCHWKQEKLQKELNKKGILYKVILTLPTEEDLKNIQQREVIFRIPTKNYTEQWKITNPDYNLFIETVRDSIFREQLYLKVKSDEVALKLLNYTDIYFDEKTLEFTEYNPIKRILGDSIFPLNYKTKIASLKIDSRIIDSIKKSDDYLHPMYNFTLINSKRSSQTGDLKIIDGSKSFFLEGFGKNLDLSLINLFNQSSSIRSFENYKILQTNISQEVILKNEINNQPESLIQNITYDQAIAYYYWKYPIHNPNPKDNWQNFVLPTKEQFEEIQKGKTIILEEKQVAYPTPVFRYVVHLYEW